MLPDYLAPDLEVIFCGTAAGQHSAQIGHYYAGKGNRFWKTLHEVGLTKKQMTPQQDSEILEYGIGLTDLAKGVSGMDRHIPDNAYAPQRLNDLVEQYRPKRIAFTSLKAARIALRDPKVSRGRLQTSPFSPVKVWALPSPSGAARGYWDIRPWEDLAKSIMG